MPRALDSGSIVQVVLLKGEASTSTDIGAVRKPAGRQDRSDGTIGVMAFIAKPIPRLILVVPILWSVIGGQAAILLSVPQDFGLLVAGAIGVALAFRST